MRLSEVIPAVFNLLQGNPFFTDVEIIASIDADYNKKLESALRDKGLALVIVQAEGTVPNTKAPRIRLDNAVMVSVLENPAKNTTGPHALEAAEKVLETIHQAAWGQHGLQNQFTCGTPAYELGPLDGGLVVYFCNFNIATVQP